MILKRGQNVHQIYKLNSMRRGSSGANNKEILWHCLHPLSCESSFSNEQVCVSQNFAQVSNFVENYSAFRLGKWKRLLHAFLQTRRRCKIASVSKRKPGATHAVSQTTSCSQTAWQIKGKADFSQGWVNGHMH